MNPLGAAAWAWRGVIALIPRPAIWVPFILVAFVQALFLLLIVNFHRPALLGLGEPLIRLLAGEGATHYPILYYALPTVFVGGGRIITILITSIALGAATLLFAKALGVDQKQKAWNRALKCAPALIVVTLIEVGLLYGLGKLPRIVPNEAFLGSFAVRWGVRGTMLLLFIVVQSFLVYTTAWIVLMGHRFWSAIRDSVRVTARTFLPTMIVVGVPALLLFPFAYASSKVVLIVDKFRPEMVASLLGIQIVAEIIVAFFLVGAVTRLFLWRVEASR